MVVTGEFGRTPKINYQPSTGAGNASAPAGTKQPGRDHWPRAFSNLWAGGGIETGRFIGATDKRGEDSIERRCGPGDFLATIYHHLGIDAKNVHIKDFKRAANPCRRPGTSHPRIARVKKRRANSEAPEQPLNRRGCPAATWRQALSSTRSIRGGTAADIRKVSLEPSASPVGLGRSVRRSR